MSNMNFLIADEIWFSSDTKITSSQGGATKIKSKQFFDFGSRTKLFLLAKLETFSVKGS